MIKIGGSEEVGFVRFGGWIEVGGVMGGRE